MECHLGRKLLQNEHVHHKNKNPLDNRIENLEVVDPNTHLRMHKQVYPDIKICEWCGEEYTVHHRKRKRQKCCSKECAYKLRTKNMAITRGYTGW
jgi:hypothetical protein